MNEKNPEILIYLPYNKESIADSDYKWMDSFESILNLNLKQILKADFRILRHHFEQSKNISETINQSNIIIQLLIKNHTEDDHLVFNVLSEDQIKQKSIFNLICDPDYKNMDQSFSKQGKYLIFYDELSGKKIDLANNIQNLKSNIWLKFLDLSFEIRKEISKNTLSKKNNIGSIYLAETTEDQAYYRSVLKRELEHLGYRILPENKLSNDLNEFSDQVHENLKECILSINIIGNNYEPLNKNIEVSGIELQNDLFSEVMAMNQKEIHRLVWISPDIKPKSEKQKQYIESFKRNIELLRNTEIIQTPIEVFKSIIKKKASKIINKREGTSIKEDEVSQKTVYLLYNDKDTKTLKDVRNWFTKQGIQTLETNINGNKVAQIKEHYSNLVNTDSVLILYTSINEQWLNSKISDLLKAPGFGRRNKFLSKSIIYTTKQSPRIFLQIPDLEIIDLQNEEIDKKLNSFTEKIK